MSTQRKDLYLALGLLGGFVVILWLMFSPISEGKTPMMQMDNLFNSISKGSVYYINELAAEGKEIQSNPINIVLQYEDPVRVKQMMTLFEKTNIEVTRSEKMIRLKGSLNVIISRALQDADYMFKNQGDKIRETYGYDERVLLYNWWVALKQIEKELIKEQRFSEAKYVKAIITKAIECSYNYYRIEPKDISGEAHLVILSLVFYVIYTLWFGYAILFLFKGLGLKLEH